MPSIAGREEGMLYEKFLKQTSRLAGRPGRLDVRPFPGTHYNWCSFGRGNHRVNHLEIHHLVIEIKISVIAQIMK